MRAAGTDNRHPTNSSVFATVRPAAGKIVARAIDEQVVDELLGCGVCKSCGHGSLLEVD